MRNFKDRLHRLWHAAHPGQPCGDPYETVSDTILRRQMLYDAFSDPERVAELLNLPPISEEVSTMERSASLVRLQNLGPIMPLLMDQAEFMAAAATAVQIAKMEEPPLLEQVEVVRQVFDSMFKVVLVSAFGGAIEHGVVSLDRWVSVGPPEEDQ